eukprot:CAMPEP_0194035920 /NCGR_PEP_ID=MMETSP0009_2-20130614/8334_1 /TAXON_ID=210454 /ORGANISM="Grammatophora oceanica, Strain CCMP 410" /LENGTH=60 /DNA_ID=CAMNT_0038677483 /DNA_START=179 /DNA_END=357 /DNA_ORIENTATION=+
MPNLSSSDTCQVATKSRLKELHPQNIFNVFVVFDTFQDEISALKEVQPKNMPLKLVALET